MPRNRVTLGATWNGPQRLFVNLQALWRGERYSTIDRQEQAGSPGVYLDNSKKLKAGWDAGGRIYWESHDKHWSVDAIVANILSKNTSTSYSLDVKYRF